MATTRAHLGTIAAAALLASACTLQDVAPPSPTGPSTLGLSLNVSASPDILPEDGRSESVIRIVARGPDGQPIPNVPVRVDTMVGATIVEVGKLSAHNVATNGNGEATVVFTAPPSPLPGTDLGSVVNIRVTPVAGDYGSLVGTSVSIRLVPETIAQVPGAPVPVFFFLPSEPKANQPVVFDATASFDPDGTIVSYLWNYGDGDFDNDVVEQHMFAEGTYIVTLTVTDNSGKTASLSKSVTVRPAS